MQSDFAVLQHIELPLKGFFAGDPDADFVRAGRNLKHRRSIANEFSIEINFCAAWRGSYIGGAESRLAFAGGAGYRLRIIAPQRFAKRLRAQRKEKSLQILPCSILLDRNGSDTEDDPYFVSMSTRR
jgi:hypothetical protein